MMVHVSPSNLNSCCVNNETVCNTASRSLASITPETVISCSEGFENLIFILKVRSISAQRSDKDVWSQ